MSIWVQEVYGEFLYLLFSITMNLNVVSKNKIFQNENK